LCTRASGNLGKVGGLQVSAPLTAPARSAGRPTPPRPPSRPALDVPLSRPVSLPDAPGVAVIHPLVVCHQQLRLLDSPVSFLPTLLQPKSSHSERAIRTKVTRLPFVRAAHQLSPLPLQYSMLPMLIAAVTLDHSTQPARAVLVLRATLVSHICF